MFTLNHDLHVYMTMQLNANDLIASHAADFCTFKHQNDQKRPAEVPTELSGVYFDV